MCWLICNLPIQTYKCLWCDSAFSCKHFFKTNFFLFSDQMSLVNFKIYGMVQHFLASISHNNYGEILLLRQLLGLPKSCFIILILNTVQLVLSKRLSDN